MDYVGEMAVIGVLSHVRARGLLAVLTVLVTACGLTAGVANAAPAAPVSADAGPGCPATMMTWTPRVTAVPSADPAAVAPGNLSARARTAFGRKVARMLAGHHEPLRWVSQTGCRILPFSAGPARRAAPAAVTAGSSRAAERPAVAPDTVNSPITSANWSGYGSDDGNFTGAAMEWTIPNPARDSSAPEGSDVTIWPGIGAGGGLKDVLVQAGSETQLQSDGSYLFWAWSEIVPGDPGEVEATGFPARPGDDMAVNVTWDPSSGNAAFFIVNYTAGQMTETTRHVTGVSGAQAEWIVERDSHCGSTCIYSPAADFGAQYVLNGTADQTVSGVITSKYIGDFYNYGPINLISCATLFGGDEPPLATPSPDVDSQGDFADNWRDWGHADPVDCTWKISPANSSFQATNPIGSPVRLTDATANLTLTCSNALLSGTTGAAEQEADTAEIASITGSNASCTDPAGNSWTVQQLPGTTWTLTGDVGSFHGRTTSDIKGISADVAGKNSGGTCTFHISGSVPQGKAVYQNPLTLTITGASLEISQVIGAGCAAAKIANNDSATLSGTYSFPYVTVDP